MAAIIAGLSVPIAVYFLHRPVAALPGSLRLTILFASCIAMLLVGRFLSVFVTRRDASGFLRERLLDCGVPVCLACGYCLRGIASERCPECGVELPPRVREIMAYPAKDGAA
jgi:hypothetical protein